LKSVQKGPLNIYHPLHLHPEDDKCASIEGLAYVKGHEGAWNEHKWDITENWGELDICEEIHCNVKTSEILLIQGGLSLPLTQIM
jgi:hypothetical protein